MPPRKTTMPMIDHRRRLQDPAWVEQQIDAEQEQVEAQQHQQPAGQLAQPETHGSYSSRAGGAAVSWCLTLIQASQRLMRRCSPRVSCQSTSWSSSRAGGHVHLPAPPGAKQVARREQAQRQGPGEREKARPSRAAARQVCQPQPRTNQIAWASSAQRGACTSTPTNSFGAARCAERSGAAPSIVSAARVGRDSVRARSDADDNAPAA